jgi:hypothetical protein
VLVVDPVALEVAVSDGDTLSVGLVLAVVLGVCVTLDVRLPVNVVVGVVEGVDDGVPVPLPVFDTSAVRVGEIVCDTEFVGVAVVV